MKPYLLIAMFLLSFTAAADVKLECAELHGEDQDSLALSEDVFLQNNPVIVQFTKIKHNKEDWCFEEAQEGGLRFFNDGASSSGFCSYSADAGNEERIMWLCRQSPD